MMPASFTDRHVCILGLGYVGLTLAVVMADAGFHVHGLEVRQEVLDGLAQDKPHFWEPQLAEKLARVRAKGRFTFSRDLTPDVKASVYIITVGTPLGKDGKATLTSVQQATRQISGHLKDDALVILRSTVKLGTARNVVRPILDETGKRYAIAVCPERTLEGKAMLELRELPQIIGADDAETQSRGAQIFGLLTATTVKIAPLEAAELVKLVDNTYRDVSFAFGNEVAKLCAHVGVSAQEVIRAGKLGYPRTNVAWPGPVGGPCLEKDPHILVESAASVGVDMMITKASRATNEQQPAEVAARLKAFTAKLSGFSNTPVIRIVGLAFKGVPATDDLRGTMAVPIIEQLRTAFPGATISGWDAVVKPEDTKAFFGFSPVETLTGAFDGADLVVVANNHPSMQISDLGALAAKMHRPGVIFDYWNMHGVTDALPNGVHYLGLGVEKGQV
jgi:UDP-N-acetyl-D-mannosaminuronic acid dehydrogenase